MSDSNRERRQEEAAANTFPGRKSTMVDRSGNQRPADAGSSEFSGQLQKCLERHHSRSGASSQTIPRRGHLEDQKASSSSNADLIVVERWPEELPPHQQGGGGGNGGEGLTPREVKQLKGLLEERQDCGRRQQQRQQQEQRMQQQQQQQRREPQEETKDLETGRPAPAGAVQQQQQQQRRQQQQQQQRNKSPRKGSTNGSFSFKVCAVMNLVATAVVLVLLVALFVARWRSGRDPGGDSCVRNPSPGSAAGGRLSVAGVGRAEELPPWVSSASGESYGRFRLTNAAGMEVDLLSLGAAVTAVRVPRNDGRSKLDVALGFDDVDAYMDRDRNPYFGASVGRVANRIAGARFLLDGKVYNVSVNDQGNALHGGVGGFSWKNWEGRVQDDNTSVVFTYLSPHMEEGFPGNMIASARYTLGSDGELMITYKATSDRATPVNMCNHLYWNLGGHDTGRTSLKEHLVTVNADHYLPVNSEGLPTGVVEHVGGSPYDLRTPTILDHVIAKVFVSAPERYGFDHNFVVARGRKRDPGARRPVNFVARAENPLTSVALEVFTDQPGLQLYTGNFLPLGGADPPLRGKSGADYAFHGAVCLETQLPPNAINHVAGFAAGESVVLRPGEEYVHNVVYKLSTKHK